MERKSSGHEFEAVIDHEGRIAVPPDAAKHFAGRKLHVRLLRSEISASLAKNNVTEEEVDRIASLQLESREQVVAFLTSEGSLRNDTVFRRRVSTKYGPARGKRR